jgi:hypothetical protein
MMHAVPRIVVGIAILAILAIVNIRRRGREATRWREYCFLFLCVGAAMVYGAVNDQITSRISWEYFYYGKELAPRLGPQTPPDGAALSWQAARIGAEATWSAGLIIGTAMLIANNPSLRRGRLSYLRLAARLPNFVGITVVFAGLFGAAGWNFWLNWMAEDFRELAQTDLWRPHRFMMVYGIHLGGYVGGAVATIYNARKVFRMRPIN